MVIYAGFLSVRIRATLFISGQFFNFSPFLWRSDGKSASSITEEIKTTVLSVKIRVISEISGKVFGQVLISSITNS